jgi:putative membrane protein
MAALVGLMVGSLRALWPWLTDDRGVLAPTDGNSLLLAVGLAALGAAIVLVAAWLTRHRLTEAPASR